MKQVFASNKGVIIKEVPPPSLLKGFILIKVEYSCISAGTEISGVKEASKSLIKRAFEDPEKIKKVFKILKNQGIKRVTSTISSVEEKLNSTGYSISGEIIALGEDINNFKVGDKVSAGGAGYAVHAGIVAVPKNLVVKVPDGLDMKYASIGTIGSIAMLGVRRANLSLDEYGVVLGTGLLGLFALQMLKASGVKVACIDINSQRLSLARELGADKVINSTEEDPVTAIKNWTNGHGTDAVLFTAATNHDEPLSQAFNMCRRRGRVILVGVSGMNIKREDIYKNELDFMISTSYGPGRYDNRYEMDGIDYPYAYVRWTENRNISSFLNLVNTGKIEIEKLKPLVYNIDKAKEAFNGIQQNPENHIITILDYSYNEENKENSSLQLQANKKIDKDKICIGLIGSGSFASGTLLPIINDNKNKFYLKTIVNRSGDKALNVAKQFGAEKISSNDNDIFNDSDIDLVMICTRHNNHADLVLNSLKHGKHVYVEKPLATTLDELNKIEEFYNTEQNKQKPALMVGFNRRFSKCAREIKRVLDQRSSPALIHYRMNAGFIPEEVWVHKDGGRIIGEGCHLIDLMQYLTGSEITNCNVNAFNPRGGMYLSEDNRSISLEFNDGSIAVIDYFSCGNKNLPKEYMEVHFEGKSIFMNDYKLVTGYGIKLNNCKSSIQEKGHKEEWLALYKSLKDGKSPISLESLFSTTKISILASK